MEKDQIRDKAISDILNFFRSVESPIPFVDVDYDRRTILTGKEVFLVHREISEKDIKNFKDPEFNDTGWDRWKAAVGLSKKLNADGNKEYTELSDTAWYRLHLRFPDHLPAHPVGIRLGIIFDANEVYFNGRLIDITGKISPLEHALDKKRIYVLPTKLIRPGKDNVLAIRIKGFEGNLTITKIRTYCSVLHSSN